MRTLRRILLGFVAVTLLSLVLPPGILWAQTSGVGSDGLTRLGWLGTDGRLSLWRLDATLEFQLYHEYGPYPGYTAESLSIDPTNNSLRVLWKHTTGVLSVWTVDANLAFVRFHEYGPFFGYDPTLGYDAGGYDAGPAE